MNIELVPGLTNVVRFPVELRVPPSMEVLYEIAPDVREVLRIGESFGLELPPDDLRDQVDASTATYIAEHILPLPRPEQKPLLAEMLMQALRRAIDACGRADAISKRSVAAQQRLLRAQVEGGCWLPPLEDTAEALVQEAAAAMIVAHRHCEAARGVNRAVGMALRGETWTPDSPVAATEWLIQSQKVG